jgi:hypothetical protein
VFTGDPGQHEVEYDQVESALRELLQRVVAIGGRGDPVTLALEVGGDGFSYRFLVLDEEDAARFGDHRSSLARLDRTCGPGRNRSVRPEAETA